MARKSYEIDMCSGSILPKMLRFSIPLMFSSILQLLFNAADIVVVAPRDADVVVEFDTVPRESWLVQAQPTVLRLAPAMYDGASAEVRNSILNEVL